VAAVLWWLVRDGKMLRGLGSMSRNFRWSQLLQSIPTRTESLDGRRRRVDSGELQAMRCMQDRAAAAS
jgi:hypothetical protein